MSSRCHAQVTQPWKPRIGYHIGQCGRLAGQEYAPVDRAFARTIVGLFIVVHSAKSAPRLRVPFTEPFRGRLERARSMFCYLLDYVLLSLRHT
jgi:hypothetical protein